MQVKFARSILAGAAVAAGVALATPATASAQMGFVVQGQYAADAEAVGVGGGINFGIGSMTANHGIRAEATFDYFFVDDPATAWEINGNLMYDIGTIPGLYIGAGVNYASFGVDDDACPIDDCGDSDIGINLLGGWNFAGSKGPFVFARFAIGGGDQLYAGGGFRF